MDWLDILTGEVRARRDSRQHAEAQRNETDQSLRHRRVTAALRYVARPALEQIAARLEKNGQQPRLSASDEDGIELSVDGKAHVGARAEGKDEIVLYWCNTDKDEGERRVVADALTSAMIRDLARGVLVANGA